MTTPLSEHVRTVLFSRAPEVTLGFWAITILATTTGATFADYLGIAFGLRITTAIMGALLVTALTAEFVTKRYTSGVYWTVVVLISTFVTLIIDDLTGLLGIERWVSSLICMGLLALTLGSWFRRERTLSIQTIFTRRREAFYWLTVLLAFALGTAAGDLIADALGLGYLFGAILFAALIGVIVIARFALNADAVFCFWAAYILTRPFGASFGDLLSQPPADGGLGLGIPTTTVIFLVIIVGAAAYLAAKVYRQRAEAVAAFPESALSAAS